MLRWLAAIVLGASLGFCPSVFAGDRDRDDVARGGKREAQRKERTREQRERERAERAKKRQDRKLKTPQPHADRTKPKKANEDDPRRAKPSPPLPKPSESESTEAKPTETPEEKPAEPLPKPADKVEVQKPKQQPNEQLDADFALQGEYLGDLSSSPLAGRAGLQVIALGDGKFEAYLLKGGLPGNGWLRGSQRPKLAGERDGANATLRGEFGSAAIDGEVATITDAQGRAIGALKKVLRRSPTLGAAPAAGAKVLFNGSSTDEFQTARLTDDGLLGVGALTKDPVGDFQMHVEFRTPLEPKKRGQGRGNSGIYIQERYEVQVLDSFGLGGDASECGSLYRQRKPDFNLCLPPLSWQTYDIYFRAARFDTQGKKIANARITLFHNGIAVHDDVELTGKTGAGQKEEPTMRPIRFQDHGNPVVYRNIWLVPGQGRATPVAEACCE